MSRCIFTSLILICFVMPFLIEKSHARQLETTFPPSVTKDNFAVSSLTCQSDGFPHGIYNVFLVTPEGRSVNTSRKLVETGLKPFAQSSRVQCPRVFGLLSSEQVAEAEAREWHNERVLQFDNFSASNEWIQPGAQSSGGFSSLFNTPFRLLMPAISLLMIHYEYNQLAIIFVGGSLMLGSDWISDWIGGYEPYRQYLKAKITLIGRNEYIQAEKGAGYYREMPGYVSMIRYGYDSGTYAEPSKSDRFRYMESQFITPFKWRSPEKIMAELGIIHRDSKYWLKQEIDHLSDDDLIGELLIPYSMELLNLAAQFNEVLWSSWQNPNFSFSMKVLGLQAVFNYWLPIEAQVEDDDCSLLTMSCLLKTMSYSVKSFLSKYWLVTAMVSLKLLLAAP